MGVWDVIHGAVKEPVTNAYSKIDEVGRAAASKIDEGVRFHGDGVKQKVKKYLPAPEGREKMIQVLTHPATKEAIKFVAPGGAQAAYNIVGSLLLGNLNQNDIDEEQNKYEHVIQQMKVLQAENERMQKELNKLMVINNNSSSSSSTTVSEQMPEEVTAHQIIFNPHDAK